MFSFLSKVNTIVSIIAAICTVGLSLGLGAWIKDLVDKHNNKKVNSAVVANDNQIKIDYNKLIKSVGGIDELKNVTVYKNQRAAENDILNDIINSEYLKFFGLRAGFFVTKDGVFSDVLNNHHKDIHILIANPDNKHVQNRLHKVPIDDIPAYMNILHGIHSMLLTRIKGKSLIECRYHEEPIIFRIYITSARLYFSFYEEGKTSEKSNIYCVENGTLIYKGLNAYFDEVWGNSVVKTLELRSKE